MFQKVSEAVEMFALSFVCVLVVIAGGLCFAIATIVRLTFGTGQFPSDSQPEWDGYARALARRTTHAIGRELRLVRQAVRGLE